MRRIDLLLDDDDYRDIQAAIAERQTWRLDNGDPLLADGDSNTAGAYLAEICRGWLEKVRREKGD